MNPITMAKPIYVLIDEKLLASFDKARRKAHMNRSEAIREAMKRFSIRPPMPRKAPGKAKKK